MDIRVSNSISLKNIRFNHAHIHDDATEGLHSHDTEVRLTFRAAAGELTALPMTNKVIQNVRDKITEIANREFKGNFEESAAIILREINDWIPELKEKCRLRSNFQLSCVEIETPAEGIEQKEGVRHPNIDTITYRAEIV